MMGMVMNMMHADEHDEDEHDDEVHEATETAFVPLYIPIYICICAYVCVHVSQRGVRQKEGRQFSQTFFERAMQNRGNIWSTANLPGSCLKNVQNDNVAHNRYS